MDANFSSPLLRPRGSMDFMSYLARWTLLFLFLKVVNWKGLFLQVISGQEIIQKIELLETDTDDHPKQDVVIADCGELALNVPFIVSDQPYE